MDTDVAGRGHGAELLWAAEPNRWVERVAEPLPAGRALDLAAGEGRNAVWLVERGWDVTAVDQSAAALARAHALAEHLVGPAPARLHTVAADLAGYQPEPAGYDLVLVVHVHVPAPVRRAVLHRAAAALAPGGHLLVVGHDRRSLAEGTGGAGGTGGVGAAGGPADPALLYDADEVLADVAGLGLTVERAECVSRPVGSDDALRTAYDCVVHVSRPARPRTARVEEER